MREDRPDLVEVERTPERPRRRAGWVGWMVAAVLTVVAITVIFVTTGGSAPEAVAVSTTSTTPDPVPSVTVAPVRLAPGVAPPPQQTVLGTLTWTEADVDGPRVPVGDIMIDPTTNEYVIRPYELDEEWRSSDAISWRRVAEPGFPDADWVYYQNDYAITAAGTSRSIDGFVTRIYERVDSEWVEIPLTEIPTPDVDGLVWQISADTPITDGSSTIIPVQLRGHIPWEDHYGSIEVECDNGETCVEVPWGAYAAWSGLVQIQDANGERIALLEVAQRGKRVVFTDTEGGNVVHRLGFGNTEAAADYLANLGQDTSVVSSYLLIRGDDGVVDPPWRYTSSILPVGDGFVAFDGLFSPSRSSDDEPVRAWSSNDGVHWVDEGPLSFLPDTYEYVIVQPVGATLVAEVVVYDEFGTPATSEWESKDGLLWEEYDNTRPVDAWVQPFELGFLATQYGSTPSFWLSPDGEEWDEIETPTSYGAVNTAFGVAGDIVYHATNRHDGTGWLFIGRFNG